MDSDSPHDLDDSATAVHWIGEIDLAEAALRPWRERCRRITRRYRDERATDSKVRRYAILWSNIQTLGPAVYARSPTAVVGRRFKDADPVGRLAGEVLERSLNYSLDAHDFDQVMQRVRDEYLLFARGQAWVRYVPTLQPRSADASVDQVTWEEVRADYVPWEDFGHNPARNWDEVRFVYRRAFMTRDELKKRFPEVGARVPLDWQCEGSNDSKDETFKKAQVYEIWDLSERKAIWISRGFSEAPLDSRDDPLGLRDFFPCPRPMFGTLGPDSLIPTPDYVYYQDQAEELDELTARIDKLTEALKFTGFYGAHHKAEFSQLLAPSNENKLVPVDSWAALKDDGGVKGLIEYWPTEQVAAVISACIDLRKQIIGDIFQITGVADVMRGASDPAETATAQGLKAQWGSLRVRDTQREIARFARDLVRIMGEVIASRFGPDTLAAMSDVQLMTLAQKAQVQQQLQARATLAQAKGEPPAPVPADLLAQLAQPSWDEVTRLLADRRLRGFRIDIETDSTIEPNAQEEKQARVEFVQAVGGFIAQSLPVVQTTPALLPLVCETLKFLVRGFRAGREMEDVIDRALDQLQAAAGGPAAQPGAAPPEQVSAEQVSAEQAKAEAARLHGQAAMLKAQTGQQQLQLEAARLQSDHQLGMAGVAAENLRTQSQHVQNQQTQDQQPQNQQLQAGVRTAMQAAVQRAEQRTLMNEIVQTTS